MRTCATRSASGAAGRDPLRPSPAQTHRGSGSTSASSGAAFSRHDLRDRRISLLYLGGVPWARIGEHVGQRNLAVTALSPGVAAIAFGFQGNHVSAFPGPFISRGSASINLAFTRPIKFDSVTCAPPRQASLHGRMDWRDALTARSMAQREARAQGGPAAALLETATRSYSDGSPPGGRPSASVSSLSSVTSPSTTPSSPASRSTSASVDGEFGVSGGWGRNGVCCAPARGRARARSGGRCRP